MAHRIYDLVAETATTTGTGAFTVLGARTGSRAFSSVMSVGDTCDYTIRAVDSFMQPTGEWESGVATYSGINTLTRTIVTDSSNAGIAVSFSAGTKTVELTMHSMRIRLIRDYLTANRTYYVRTDGSDSNNGLVNNSGGAFLTIQKAVDTVCNSLWLAGFTATIQVADGTYTGETILKPIPGYGSVIIVGNLTTPASVLISVTSGRCFITSGFGADYTIKGVKLQTTTSGSGIVAFQGGNIVFGTIDFGECVGAHIYSDQGRISALTTSEGNYSITGGANWHLSAINAGVISSVSKTVTLTGTPAFAGSFVAASGSACIAIGGNTYSGAATGKRYDVQTSSSVTSGVTLPGSVAGTTATGGQYV